METISNPLQKSSGISGISLKRISEFFTSDPRHYQITFLLSFLLYGSFALKWDSDPVKIILIFSVCTLTQLVLAAFTNRDYHSIKSAIISALSLCLMLKTNLLLTAVFAAFLSIIGKYLIRFKGKHVFNPTNFGIILSLLIFSDAWISPGQWGSDAFSAFFLGAFGLLVLLRVKRFDTAISFLLAFGLVHYLRTVVYLGWTVDVFLQQMTSGTLLLFTFFMITDPKTTPSSFKARLIWSSLIGILAAYLQIRYWVNGSALWALFVLSPFTPLFDKIFGGELFQWTREKRSIQVIPISAKNSNGTSLKIIGIMLILVLSIPSTVNAFCGFYVAKADASLFNKSSQVIIVRDENHTVITMSSDYRGELKDFAMVVPVPVILKKSDIRIVERVLFDSFDAYSGPRLVEYWDENPCWERERADRMLDIQSSASRMEMSANEEAPIPPSTVKIEAQYVVGEYDILILSAKESGGLETWLLENGYRIPQGAKGVLEPYIRSGMKFFVVKVNLEGFKTEGNQLLRPIQIAFHSEKFMLPIRLGMANAQESQDMIVYALSRKGRVETSNYRTVQVPTDKKVPVFVKDQFGEFYRDTYNKTVQREGKRNVFLEYAWDISGSNFMKCDPCASNPPVYADLINAGATWLNSNRNGTYNGSVYFTRLHVTYDRENFAQDLVFQETPNRQNFQARYILTHTAPGPFNCVEGKAYLQELRKRRYKELQELHSLTGWNINKYDNYLQESMGYVEPDDLIKSVKKKAGMAKEHIPVLIQKKTDTMLTKVANREPQSDSVRIIAKESNIEQLASSAGTSRPKTDYKIVFAVLALGALYLIERRRR